MNWKYQTIGVVVLVKVFGNTTEILLAKVAKKSLTFSNVK